MTGDYPQVEGEWKALLERGKLGLRGQIYR